MLDFRGRLLYGRCEFDNQLEELVKHRHYTEIPAEDVGEGAKGVVIRWLIDEKTGAPNFAMRRFEIEPGGYTPLHEHDWEHELFILEGEGLAVSESGEQPIKAGDAIFMPSNERHQFRNTGPRPLTMLCMIPLKT
jgi:quercetin dioxygenase-like cupin family protein